jgi:Ser/Thr protein kinase RdoA (MazF antagonist)
MLPPLPDFVNIVPHFCFEGDFLRAQACGFGHINDTYEGYFRKAGGEIHRYLLQRINSYVFEDIEGLMHNITAVTAHLRAKIAAAGGNPDRETLTIIPTTAGATFHRTPGGEFWRAYLFIEGAQTYEVAMNQDQIYHAGRALGHFLELLGDFPTARLVETIPDFHHTVRRFQAFVRAVERDIKNRAHGVRPEIEFVQARVQDTSVLLNLLDRGALRARATHNDTKFNNVMIDDETGEGLCLVDLDTVMPGLALYDFGDAVRYAANPAAEDEQDLSKVGIKLETYGCLVRGFLYSARSFLTSQELDHLSFSAKLMALECGMRFLTDYLRGDPYFRISRKSHNLDRARTQFKMVQDMEASFDQMEKIVDLYR